MPRADRGGTKDLSGRARAEKFTGDDKGGSGGTKKAERSRRGAQTLGAAKAGRGAEGVGDADQRAASGHDGAEFAESAAAGGAGSKEKEAVGRRAGEPARHGELGKAEGSGRAGRGLAEGFSARVRSPGPGRVCER